MLADAASQWPRPGGDGIGERPHSRHRQHVVCLEQRGDLVGDPGSRILSVHVRVGGNEQARPEDEAELAAVSLPAGAEVR